MCASPPRYPRCCRACARPNIAGVTGTRFVDREVANTEALSREVFGPEGEPDGAGRGFQQVPSDRCWGLAKISGLVGHPKANLLSTSRLGLY
jgi:hypothetical protein